MLIILAFSLNPSDIYYVKFGKNDNFMLNWHL